jgi:hypothetical protein
MKVKIGSRVRDFLTGFEGVAFARTEYLTGCAQICIKPTELNKDGEIREGTWVDETRIEVLNLPEGQMADLVAKTYTTKEQDDPGGPQEIPMGRQG